MFSSLRNLTIVKRLGWVFAVANGLALACMFFSVSAIVLYFSQLSFKQELSAVIQVIATTSRAAIAFDDSEAGKRVLGALQGKRDIEYVVLLDRQSTFLVEQGGFGANSEAKSVALSLAKEQKENNSRTRVLRWSMSRLAMAEPVVLDGEVLGDVVAVVELKALYQQIFLLICIAAGVTVVIAVSAFFFLFKLRSWVIEPLRNLKSLTQEVSVTKDFTSRIGPVRDDELNELFEAFNNMLSQLGERERSLLLAKERAEQADRAKSMFVASVSHELRTPLHTIIGLAEEVLESKLEPAQKELMQSLVIAGNSLLMIINDILDFSKIEAGKLSIEPAPFQIRSVIERVRGIFQNPTEKKTISLNFIVGAEVPSVLIGDIHRIMQVLINLVGNAVKFTPEGGLIEVGVQPYRGENAKPSMVQFSVRDTGIGIPVDKLTIIFQAFTQVRGVDDQIQGTGLGLAISARLVQMMSGWMWVESSLGEGSTFHFVIDCPQATDAILEKRGSERKILPSGAHKISASDNTRSAVIMVVEDNITNQKLAQRLLEKAGYSVCVASNGSEAVDIFKTQAVDLILMDINMPVMDGLEATRRIRKLEGDSGTRTPIIALTASVAADESSVCFQAGIDAFVTKPFSRGPLLQLVANYLEESRSRVIQH